MLSNNQPNVPLDACYFLTLNIVDKIDLFVRAVHVQENPVREGIVDQPEAYLFSSARDYAGIRGLIAVKVVQPQGLSAIKRISAG
jgi:hypothetical protein